MYSLSYLEPVCFSMSSSNCCFLTCIQVSQEAGQVVWYSQLFQNFPQFIVIHTVKGFGIVNKAEIDVFLELSCFFDDPGDVGNLCLFLNQLEYLEVHNSRIAEAWGFTLNYTPSNGSLCVFICSKEIIVPTSLYSCRSYRNNTFKGWHFACKKCMINTSYCYN